jgi:hypothetical protein
LQQTKIMPKLLVLLFLLLGSVTGSFASNDSLIIPLGRQYFHEKIDQEQTALNKLNQIKSRKITNPVSDSIFSMIKYCLLGGVDAWQINIEQSSRLISNNQKIRALSYLENYLRTVRRGLSQKEIQLNQVPELFNRVEFFLKQEDTVQNFLGYLNMQSLVIARALTSIFSDFPENEAAKKIVYFKKSIQNPSTILSSIDSYLSESFADTLLYCAAKWDPSKVYSYAQSDQSPIGKAIHQSQYPLVHQIAVLSQKPNALLFFPFLDDIISGKTSLEDLDRQFSRDEKVFDSIGYFRLLVKTELQYYARMLQTNDTPVAMFGANGLRETLFERSKRHFIDPINQMHDESNLDKRMKPIDGIQPVELYFLIVNGENDMYTSSFKHTFNRLITRMGKKPRGDSLLLSVQFNQFRKFIKILAAYNRLDTFLKTMPAGFAESLMQAFVSDLDNSDGLEAATDVADSYASIQNSKLRLSMLSNIKSSALKAASNGNWRGEKIYGLLNQIFLSLDSSKQIKNADLYSWDNVQQIECSKLKDDSGRIVELVFFYGDEDGKLHFPGFIQSFPNSDWKITTLPEWVEIRSRKSNVFVYANRPLDYNENLDDSAQAHLIKHLDEKGMMPSIVVHRGHSYWLPSTIRKMPFDAKIILIGSCGGYKNLTKILSISPQAQIISTKEIGAGDINRPIMNYLHQSLNNQSVIDWKKMWGELGKLFSNEKNKSIRDSWESYIPPYRNLGSIFIKAYYELEEEK